MKQILIFISILSFGGIAARAQVEFAAEVDTNQILIGEQLVLQLQARMPENSEFEWPILPDTLSGMELVSTGKLDTLSENGRWRIVQKLRLTSFDSGYTAIPPLRLRIDDQSWQSEAIGVAVSMPELSEAEDYYDIKAPLEAPFNWWPVIISIVAVIAIAALIWWIIAFLHKRRATSKLTPEEVLSPIEYAELQLRELKKEQLWQSGRIKEYYSRLTDIMRLYMERQMQVNAMESTADEVVEQINDLNISSQLKARIQKLMQLSVLVKYAKEAPTEAEHEESLKSVEEFLNETRPREEETEKTRMDS